MIKFFRRIRQKLISENRFSKYLIYAIGEIILVVLGILIALKINNWNESKIENKNQQLILLNLIEDLKIDSTWINTNITTATRLNSLHKEIYLIGVKGKNADSLKNTEYLRRSTFIRVPSLENDSNIPNKIKDEDIRKALQRYFQILTFNSEVITRYVDFVNNEMRPFLRQIEVFDLHSLFEDSSNSKIALLKDELVRQSKTVPFQQMLFEANTKSRLMQPSLERLMEQNIKLQGTINNHLNKHYD